MSDGRVWFVADRFERLRDLLFSHGFALDPGARDPNGWDEQHWEDPPTGLVRLKAVRLRDLDDEESDFDPEITFSLQEFWSSSHLGHAEFEQGYYLVAYSYHGHCHGVDQRWDFDFTGHPEMPYHCHPPDAPTQRRQLDGPIAAERALTRFEQWVAEHLSSTQTP